MKFPRHRKCATKFDPAEFLRRGLALERIAPRAPDTAPRSLGHCRAVAFRPYQKPVFDDRTTGIVVLHWSRQIGKSFTLAAWAVDRLLTRPGRLVTVLSNSRENGAEFLAKCAEFCRLNDPDCESDPDNSRLDFQSMRLELRIRVAGKTGRIKVLAANPRTARGFSGDLILDEFAFHEDARAIWDAAEPILASNPDFLCRIASTGNGRHNLFYEFACPSLQGSATWPSARTPGAEFGASPDISPFEVNGELAKCCSPSPVSSPPGRGFFEARISDFPKANGELPVEVASPSVETGSPSPSRMREGEGRGEVALSFSSNSISPPRTGICLSRTRAGFLLSRVTRSEAWRMGTKIFHPVTREEISPETARAASLDPRAYDQNYECAFADENLTLLSWELIAAAEQPGVGEIAEQDWTAAQLRLLRDANGPLYAGFDVARRGDLSVITVVENFGGILWVRAILRIRDMRLPGQQQRLAEICRLPRFHRASIDMTGLGLGLFEYAQREFGSAKIHGINFGSTVPATDTAVRDGARRQSVRVTEALAMELLQAYENRQLRQPPDNRLRDDLRKPERVTTPAGRVSIAATRDESGHADHFWSLALAVECASLNAPVNAIRTFPILGRNVTERQTLI